MKRFSSFIILTALLASLAACGGTTPAADDTTAPVTSEDTTTVAETEKPYLDNLPEMNFEGETLNVLIRASRNTQLTTEDENGEILNDAVFARNRSVADRFNVKITFHELDDKAANWNAVIDGDVASGSGEFDVVMPDYWWGCENRGNFLDLMAYDAYIDFDAPYWCAGWNNNATIYGQLYNAVGSLCLDLVRNMQCVYYNKTIVDELKLENPYDIVNSGAWTLDKFTEMSKSALMDLNGDSAYDIKNDRLGAVTNLHSLRGLLISGGIQVSEKLSDGTYQIKKPDERFVDCYKMIYDLVHTEDSFKHSEAGSGFYTTEFEGNAAFIGDRLLFLCNAFRATEALRDMKSDFGIIPAPKMDDQQKDYIAYNLGTYYLAVPKTAKNPEMAAVILEALNAESYKSVVPTYYESMLKVKFSRDEETAGMLDKILNSTYFDFAFVNESATKSIIMSISGSLTAHEEDIVSSYEKKYPSAQAGLEAHLAKFKESVQ